MNQVIWKFQLEVKDATVLQIPKGANFLSAGLQNDQICIWAIVNPEAEFEKVLIEVYGTGNPLPDTIEYRQFIGTVVAGQFVWHIFKVYNETQAMIQNASKFLL